MTTFLKDDSMLPSYVIVTPARNEEAFIEKTLQSMVSQTVLPLKWVIVSDGSTDRTDEIVKGYASANPWIELIRMPEHSDRHFAAKVQAFNAGYARVRHIGYEIIGSLDADLSFDENYMAYLLAKFAEQPELGVAGTPFVEDGSGGYDYRFTNIEHVSGACQMFRRGCFEAIGGYRGIKVGGIDWVAVTTARMCGWKTRTFTEKTVFHHRKMGTGSVRPLNAKFNLGRKDYFLGNHFFWEMLRAAYQMARGRPKLIGGITLFAGYLSAYLRKADRPISEELLRFVQAEQMGRVRKSVARLLPVRYSA
jgi:glycosyltransferase involved in cell wall biosynthesis